MKALIDLKVVFNNIEIFRQLFGFNENTNQLTIGSQIQSNICPQIKVTYSLCQTISFTKKLKSCDKYRRNVFSTLNTWLNERHQQSGGCPTDGPVETNGQNWETIGLLVELRSMSDHYLVVDKNWNNRIINLVVIRLRLEDGLSWLSTLGGAYSSLGEYDVNCAIKAGQISVSQLRLACSTGDPNIIAKCGIYMAYSLCQQRRRKEAVKVIKRTLFPFILKIEFCDRIVKSMFSALVYRVNHFYH